MIPDKHGCFVDKFAVIRKHRQKRARQLLAGRVVRVSRDFPIAVSRRIGLADVVQKCRPHERPGIAAQMPPLCRLVDHEQRMVPDAALGMVTRRLIRRFLPQKH